MPPKWQALHVSARFIIRRLVGPNSSLRCAVDIRRANRRCMTHCCTARIHVRCVTLVLNIKRIYLSKRGSNWGGGDGNCGVAWTRTEWGRRAHLNRRKLPSPTGFSGFPWQPNILLNIYIYIYIYICTIHPSHIPPLLGQPPKFCGQPCHKIVIMKTSK